MNPSEIDIALLSNQPELERRCRALCSDFGFSLAVWRDIDAFLAEGGSPKLVLASFLSPEGRMRASELAQAVRFGAPEPFLICVVDGTLAKEEAVFAKKSGANLILLEEELFGTAKLEFATTQVIRSRYLPLKASDLAVDSILPFDVFHLLPMRRKFLPFAFAGDLLRGCKLDRAREVGELYIERSSVEALGRYVKETSAASAEQVSRRCRGLFLALFGGFSKLVFQLSDQSEHASLGDGQDLLKRCRSLCSELLMAMSQTGNPWEIINNSAIGELGSIERAPAIAAYVGIFALRAGLEDVDELMLSALLADLGMLLLRPDVLRKARDGATSSLTDEERADYHAYPAKSVSLLLDRKLSIGEKLRNSIRCSRERIDGKGFPKGLPGQKIPLEAQLIAACRELDQVSMLRLGQERKTQGQALEALFGSAGEGWSKYSMEVARMLGLKPAQGVS